MFGASIVEEKVWFYIDITRGKAVVDSGFSEGDHFLKLLFSRGYIIHHYIILIVNQIYPFFSVTTYFKTNTSACISYFVNSDA